MCYNVQLYAYAMPPTSAINVTILYLSWVFPRFTRLPRVPMLPRVPRMPRAERPGDQPPLRVDERYDMRDAR